MLLGSYRLPNSAPHVSDITHARSSTLNRIHRPHPGKPCCSVKESLCVFKGFSFHVLDVCLWFMVQSINFLVMKIEIIWEMDMDTHNIEKFVCSCIPKII